MRTLISRALLATTLSVVAATACGYDPNPESGQLHCGLQNSCPENYTCTSGRCWRNGAGGSGGTTGSGGSGGSGGSASLDKFIGHWAFTAAQTTRVRVCTDGVTNETLNPYDDSFDITRGGTAALQIAYYCSWDADVNAAGTTTVLRPGKTCSMPSQDDPGITFTWHGETFTLTTTNGTSGTLEASIPYDYSGTASGSCTMHFTGPVTKS